MVFAFVSHDLFDGYTPNGPGIDISDVVFHETITGAIGNAKGTILITAPMDVGVVTEVNVKDAGVRLIHFTANKLKELGIDPPDGKHIDLDLDPAEYDFIGGRKPDEVQVIAIFLCVSMACQAAIEAGVSEEQLEKELREAMGVSKKLTEVLS